MARNARHIQVTSWRQVIDWIMAGLLLSFCVGLAIGWALHDRATVDRLVAAEPVTLPISTDGQVEELAEPEATHGMREGSAGDSVDTNTPRLVADPIAELQTHRLRPPIDGMRIEAMKGSFAERRGGGSRPHEAADILAPRQTPIRAVDSGTIAKLFVSKAGGLTIYQFDETERFCYYYAHLDRYAAGLHEGRRVLPGDVIGFVGTSGNAPPSTPHLHFAIFELTPDRRWWQGRALDPYAVYSKKP
jgi:murein DD-endopeptidase MepM/ murein hydrolase activator NlpD